MKISLLPIIVMLVSCSASEGAEQLELDTSSGVVDLASQLPNPWSRVCVVPPYAGNKSASELVGFEIDIEAKSGISMSEDISLLVTVLDQETAGLYEIERKNADFAKLGANCYPRNSARFVVRLTSGGWHELEHK